MKQYLITNGNAGEAPWWWSVLQACRYLEGAVKPWELGAESIFWTEAVIAAMNAESAAREFHEKRASRKQNRKG